MNIVRWGILGPGTIAHEFADGLLAAPSAELVAIASLDPQRRDNFGDRYGIGAEHRFSQYADMVRGNRIDAVYISTLHPMHAQHAIMCMRAGKHVLCEKPAGMTASQVIAMVEVAQQEKVFFMEAFMYRCHPQISRLLELLQDGEIGNVVHMHSAFGFNAPFSPESRVHTRSLGGGGILDVGCYPVSLSRLVAGAVTGEAFVNPDKVAAVGKIGTSGVDEVTYALLQFPSGFSAQCHCAISRDMENNALIIGEKGAIELADPWTPGKGTDTSNATITVTVDGIARVEEITETAHLYSYEAELASLAIVAGKTQAASPAMNWNDSIGNAETLDQWRLQVGMMLEEEDERTNIKLTGLLPRRGITVQRQPIKGVQLAVSSLLMRCDNRETIADGALVWDTWMEAGGNAFDTGYLYGDGLHERVLGSWLHSRGVAKDVVVVVKGGHSPFCTPRSIETQIDISLDRLRLDHAPIYLMHNDNENVPVDEFVDVLNRLQKVGKIGIAGGTNWSIERFAQANNYAAINNMKTLTILSSNMPLVDSFDNADNDHGMANTLNYRSYLHNNHVIHFSNTVLAYRDNNSASNRINAKTSSSRAESSASGDISIIKQRLEKLAQDYKISTSEISLAWTLAQSFPSFAVIAPRSPGELMRAISASNRQLTAQEILWLNLESDSA